MPASRAGGHVLLPGFCVLKTGHLASDIAIEQGQGPVAANRYRALSLRGAMPRVLPIV